jgi:hypothetical protein
LCFFTISLNYSYSQKLKRTELKNTEWFENNADTICDMFNINLKIGDSLVLFKRINKNLQENSILFGKQEFAIFGHQSYSNFIFRPKSSLIYYLTTEDNPFHTIIGQMPLWKWKLKNRKELLFYQSGEYKMTLKLVKRSVQDFYMDYSYQSSQKLIFVRVK